MSRLTYEFAPIDVSILTHPKACAAGPEAMGLWLWGQCFARVQKTDGRVHRSAVLVAWGGRRNIVLAKRLVEAGLWLDREDGDWDIHNFQAKASGQVSGSARRMRELRERRKAVGVTCDGGVRHSDVTERHLCSYSPSYSLSESSSEEIQIPEEIPSARATQTPPELTQDAPTPSSATHPAKPSREADLGHPRASNGPSEAPPPVDRFASGTASALEARERYVEAVKLHTQKSFTLPRAPFHAADLCDLLREHGPPGSADEVFAWLADVVGAWIRAADPAFTRGYAPGKLLEWLNAGKPARRRSEAEITKQGYDPNAPWLKETA